MERWEELGAHLMVSLANALIAAESRGVLSDSHELKSPQSGSNVESQSCKCVHILSTKLSLFPDGFPQGFPMYSVLFVVFMDMISMHGHEEQRVFDSF